MEYNHITTYVTKNSHLNISMSPSTHFCKPTSCIIHSFFFFFLILLSLEARKEFKCEQSDNGKKDTVEARERKFQKIKTLCVKYL